MKQQIVTIVLGAAVMLGTATSLFAQTSGVAVGGGVAGGPNGIYKDPYGYNGNNAYMMIQRKQTPSQICLFATPTEHSAYLSITLFS